MYAMSTFYTIVMLMLIVLPPVFKAIEKSLSNAGEEEKARQLKKIRDLLSDDNEGGGDFVSEDGEPASVPRYAKEEFPMFSYDNVDLAEESSSGHKEKIKNLPPELLEGGYMSVKDIVRKRNEAYARQSQQVETENIGTSKIDPRKLVLYSELMKTKF